MSYRYRVDSIKGFPGAWGDTPGEWIARRVSSAALHWVIPLYSLSLSPIFPLYTFISID